MAKKKLGKVAALSLAAAMVFSAALPTTSVFAAETSCTHEDTYYSNYTKEPTCTEEGIGDLICAVCDTVLGKDVAIPANGHSYNLAEVTKTPTKTENGVEAGILTETCDVCGATEEVELTTLPSECSHDNTGYFNFVDSTCTTDGHDSDSICLDCGTCVEKGETLKATGHTWYNDETEATCTTDGKKYHLCWNCDEGTVEVIPATGHSYGEFKTTKEATCENDGEKEAVCSKCGDVKKETIKATGHQWNDGEITTQPTTTSAGVKTFTCTVCGNTKTENIAKLSEKTDSTKTSETKKDTTVKAGTKFVVSGQTYKVTKAGKEVSFVKAKKKAKSVVIPATVENKGVTYKVTSVAAKAVKNNKKVTSVVIGANVNSISNNAFFKCPALKKVTIKTTKLTKKTASKKAFKGVSKKMVIKVPKKVKKSYAKVFAGLKVN